MASLELPQNVFKQQKTYIRYVESRACCTNLNTERCKRVLHWGGIWRTLLVVQICDYLAHLKQRALMGNYISVIVLRPLRVDLKNENSLFNLVGRSARQMFIEDI